MADPRPSWNNEPVLTLEDEEEAHLIPRVSAEPIKSSTVIAYSLPHFAMAAMYLPTHIHINIFYTDVVLVPAGTLALMTSFARCADILVDPLLGWLSDHTRTRWGRRKPYIGFSLPFVLLAYVLLFCPPDSLTTSQAAAWFGVFFGAYMVFPVWLPFRALGPELTADPNERVSLFAYSEVADKLGIILASVLPGFLLSASNDDYREAYRQLAILIAVIAAGTFSVMLYYVPERPDLSPHAPRTPLIPGVRRALRNGPFRVLLLNQVIQTFAHTMTNVMFTFYIKYVLRASHPESAISLSLLVYFGTGALSIPVWSRLALVHDKFNIWLIGIFLTLPSTFVMFFLGSGNFSYFVGLTIFSGLSHGGSSYLYGAIQADAIDYDELRTGERREGQFIAFWALIPKLIAIGSSALPLVILQESGYVPNLQPQPEEVLLTIRLLTTLVPCFLTTIAFLVASQYPINQAKALLISDAVILRTNDKKYFPAEDPVLGEGSILPAEIIMNSGADAQFWWYIDHYSRTEVWDLLQQKDFISATRRLTISVWSGLMGWLLMGMCVIPLGFFGNDVLEIIAILLGSLSMTMVCVHALRVHALSDFSEEYYETLKLHSEDYSRIVNSQ